MCSNLATSKRVHKTRNSKPHRRTVTVTATDYEFQRAVLCCLAAGWSQSPSTLMQSPAWAAPPMPVCTSRLMQSPACIKHLCMRLLNVRTLASAHNPEGWCASINSAVQVGSQQLLATSGSKHGRQVLGMCSVPKPLLYLCVQVVLVSSARTTLWAVVKTR
jgi:hypothetical protein